MKFKKTYISIAIFILAEIIYILTTAPGVTFTDSGELAAVCSTLGIAHPTGYPLFTILGFLWSLLPLPLSKVYSLNIFAGVLTAASVVVFFQTCCQVLSLVSKNIQAKKAVNIPSGKKKNIPKIPKTVRINIDSKQASIIAAATALIYAFALTVWNQAVSIEVYSLQLLLMNLIIFFVFKASLSETKSKKYYILTAFLLGLGFSNHMTTILLVLGVFFIYLAWPVEKFKSRTERDNFLLFLFLPLLLGLSFYIYLYIRSAAMPEFNWGGVSRGLDKFWYHFTGKQYQVWMFSDSQTWGVNFVKFIKAVPYQMGWLGILPLLIGFYAAFRASRELFWFLIFLILVCLVYSLNYSIHDIETYFFTAFLSMFIFIGIGLAKIAVKFPKAVPAFFLIPLLSIAFNYSENDFSDDYLVEEYTRIMAENLQPNAIIISAQWDNFCSAFWYKQRVEGYRRDVVLIDKELLRRTWYPAQLKKWYPEVCKQCENELKSYSEYLELFESGSKYDPMVIQQRYINLLSCFIDKNYGKRPIYLTIDVFQTERDIASDYMKFPEGFALRLDKENKNFPINLDKVNVEKLLKSARGKSSQLTNVILNTTALNIANLGRYAMATNRFDEARRAFMLSLRVEPENQVALQGLGQLNSIKQGN